MACAHTGYMDHYYLLLYTIIGASCNACFVVPFHAQNPSGTTFVVPKREPTVVCGEVRVKLDASHERDCIRAEV